MNKDKNNVLSNFIDMIQNSWTYAKMTQEEKTRLIDMLNSNRTYNSLKGTYNARWNILQAIYGAYLSGIGYNNFNWREDK